MRFLDLIRTDLQAARSYQGKSFIYNLFLVVLFEPRTMCVILYRINRWIARRNYTLSRFLHARRMVWYANEISPHAMIGSHFRVAHLPGIIIGKGVRIGDKCSIYNDVTIGAKGLGDKSVPVIGNGVTIFTGSKILGGITIGDNVVIGALSFVDIDIPDNSIVYGIPPNRIIKSLSAPANIATTQTSA